MRKTGQKWPSIAWSPGGRLGFSPLFSTKVVYPGVGGTNGEFPQALPPHPCPTVQCYEVERYSSVGSPGSCLGAGWDRLGMFFGISHGMFRAKPFRSWDGGYPGEGEGLGRRDRSDPHPSPRKTGASRRPR